MKFFYSIQTTLKNGFYVDYFFKNLFFYLYKKMILSNMFYFIDKFLAEKFFFNIKRLALWVSSITTSVHKMSMITIIKILFLLIIQIFVIFYL